MSISGEDILKDLLAFNLERGLARTPQRMGHAEGFAPRPAEYSRGKGVRRRARPRPDPHPLKRERCAVALGTYALATRQLHFQRSPDASELRLQALHQHRCGL